VLPEQPVPPAALVVDDRVGEVAAVSPRARARFLLHIVSRRLRVSQLRPRQAGSGAKLASVGYAAAVRRLLSISVLLLVGSLAPAAGSVSAGTTRVNVHEKCSYKLLPSQGVALTASLTFSSARGGRSATVHVTPGWNIGRLYPKAETALIVRLSPGQTARRVVTRRIPSVPRLWKQLQAGGINCASTFSYTIP